MSDQQFTALLAEIRDLQRRQTELTEQTLKNQAQALLAGPRGKQAAPGV